MANGEALVKHIIEGGALSSVEISENAKGIAQITIKVYREPGKEQEALDEAMRLYNEAKLELDKPC